MGATLIARRGSVHRFKVWFALWALCMVAALMARPAAAAAVAVSHLQVRILTGRVDLSAGSVVELRIYEAGKNVRRLALSHGDAWPGGSTHLIPLTLAEPLDPRAVVRFALHYRPVNPMSPAWEVVAMTVELNPGAAPVQRLLNTTLSGTIARDGELATEEKEGASICVSDADCDDHRRCNGHERCAPRSVAADARGCVAGAPLVCPVNEVCTEDRGCLGPQALAPRAIERR